MRPEWIKITDRLPIAYTYVALINIDQWENFPIDLAAHIYAIGYLNDDGHWMISGNRPNHRDTWTHWVALPLPPYTLTGVKK